MTPNEVAHNQFLMYVYMYVCRYSAKVILRILSLARTASTSGTVSFKVSFIDLNLKFSPSSTDNSKYRVVQKVRTGVSFLFYFVKP